MLIILRFIMRLLNTHQNRADNSPSVAKIRRQLNEIESALHLQLGLRYAAYAIADVDARNAKLDEIAAAIYNLRTNREALRQQLGCSYREFNDSCCAA